MTAFSATDGGSLLLLFPPTDGVCGLLVDATTYRTKLLQWGAGTDPKLAGSDGVIHRGVFYRLTADEIRTFRLEPGDPPRP